MKNKKVLHNAKKVVIPGNRSHHSSYLNLSVSYKKKLNALRQNNRALAQELSLARRRLQLSEDRNVSLQRTLNLQVPKVISGNLQKMVGQLKSFLDTLDQTIQFCANPEGVEIDSTILNPEMDLSFTPQQQQRQISIRQGNFSEERFAARRAIGLHDLLTLTPIDEQSLMDTSDPENGVAEPLLHARRSSTRNDVNVTRRTKSKSRSTHTDEDFFAPVQRTPSPEFPEVPQEYQCYVTLDRLPSFIAPFSTPRLGILKERNLSLFSGSPQFPAVNREVENAIPSSDSPSRYEDINDDADDVTVKIPVDMELTMIRDNFVGDIEVTMPKKGKPAGKVGESSRVASSIVNLHPERKAQAQEVTTGKTFVPEVKESNIAVPKKTVSKSNSKKLTECNEKAMAVEQVDKHSDNFAEKTTSSIRTVHGSQTKRVSFSNRNELISECNGIRLTASNRETAIINGTSHKDNDTSAQADITPCSVFLQHIVDNSTNDTEATQSNIVSYIESNEPTKSRSPVRYPDCPRILSPRIAQRMQSTDDKENSTTSCLRRKARSPTKSHPDISHSPSSKFIHINCSVNQSLEKERGGFKTAMRVNHKKPSQTSSIVQNVSEVGSHSPQRSASKNGASGNSRSSPQVVVRCLNFGEGQEVSDRGKEVTKAPVTSETTVKSVTNNEECKRNEIASAPDLAEPSVSGLNKQRRNHKPPRQLSDSSSNENDSGDDTRDTDFVPTSKPKPDLKSKRGAENFRFFSAGRGKKTNRSSKHLIKRTRIPLKVSEAKKVSPKSVFDPSFNETPPVLRDHTQSNGKAITTAEGTAKIVVLTEPRSLDIHLNTSSSLSNRSPASPQCSKTTDPVGEVRRARRNPKATKGDNKENPSKRKCVTDALKNMADHDKKDEDELVSSNTKRRKSVLDETSDVPVLTETKVKKAPPKKKNELASVRVKKVKGNGTVKGASGVEKKKNKENDSDMSAKRRSRQIRSPVMVKMEPISPAIETFNTSARSPSTPTGLPIKTRISSVTKRKSPAAANRKSAAIKSPLPARKSNLESEELKKPVVNGVALSRRPRANAANYKEPKLNAKMRRP